jgi:serine-type D-Ala-D-Ala endopeptidase (penicillin-binding protein 7)
MRFEIEKNRSYVTHTILKFVGFLFVGVFGVLGSVFFINLDISRDISQMSMALGDTKDYYIESASAKGMKFHTPLPLEKDSVSVLGEVVVRSIPEEVIVEEISPPELIGTLLDIDSFSASAIAVKDVASGGMIYSKSISDRLPLASITKLITAIVLVDSVDNWSKEAVVIDSGTPESSLYPGESYTYEDLWSAMLVGSSNRAAVTLSRAVFGNDELFLQAAREKAKEIGMTTYSFVDSTGLNDGNRASVSDVLLLLDRAMSVEKIVRTLNYKEVVVTENSTGNNRKIQSTNLLLLGWKPENNYIIIGGKTGYTVLAGYNYTMRIKSGSGILLDVTVLGANDTKARFSEAHDVVEDVLRKYSWNTSRGYIDNVSSSMVSTTSITTR